MNHPVIDSDLSSISYRKNVYRIDNCLIYEATELGHDDKLQER